MIEHLTRNPADYAGFINFLDQHKVSLKRFNLLCDEVVQDCAETS